MADLGEPESSLLTQLGGRSILDRCDACGAQAYVRVVLPYGELLFCGHHANAHLEKLAAAAICVHDERSRIASDGQAQGAGEA